MRQSFERTTLFVCLAALAIPMYAGRPQTFPNSVKYRDAGAKPATGRSGSAAIQARALRGLTETDVEVTTGQFDGTAAAAGKLDKVQVKIFDNNGDVLVTDNYRKGALQGANGTFTYDTLSRGQKVQVQANVSGIDPNRTDVVTVGTNVALRPDLTVFAVASTRAYIGAQTTIYGLVSEINGDMGAHANCVLKVDGAVVDRADGIWVDAFGTVSCEFRTTFTTLGTKQIEVGVTDVIPADYDTANNVSRATIEVVNRRVGVPVWYDLMASDYTDDSVTHQIDHQQFDASDGVSLNWVADSESYFHNHQHSVYYQADLNSAGTLSFPVTIQSSLTSDGQLFEFPSFTITEPNYTWGYPGFSTTCGETYEANRWFRACNSQNDYGGGYTYNYVTVSSSVRAGTVTYDSRNVSTTRYPDLGLVYVYESNYGPYTSDTGDPANPLPDTLGNNLVIRAMMTDATGRHFDVHGAVQLYDFPMTTNSFDNPCTSYDYTVDYGHYSGSSCSHTDSTNVGKSGSVYATTYQ